MEDVFKFGFVMLFLMGFPMLGYAGFVAVRAWQRKVDGRQGNPALLEELEDLRARVNDLEQVRGRVEELEERMDFTERVLPRPDTVRERPRS